MNKILRLGLLLTLLSFCMSGFSQISVTSFEQLPNNLDATTYHPKKDINGKTCAIIKIFTTQKGFSFDNGSLGIVAVEQKSDLAEIWVYVPEKTRKLKIAHPQLGHIKTGDNVDSEGYYWLPSAVESGQVYKMDIVTGKVRIEIEEAKVQTGWLVFNSVPDGVDIYLSQQGEEEKHIGTTPMSKKMPYGTYNYRAKKFKYHDDVGIATVDKTRVSMDLKLMPAFGAVAVSSQPQGARVFLDGEDTGKVTPCTIGGVASGSCNISLQLKDYAPASRTVAVADGQTANVQVALEARFAVVTINSLPGATIKVNGAAVGTGGYNSNMAEGIYDLEATLAGHRAVTKQIEVVAGLPQTIDLRPTPIYGMLDVNSNPMGASITINGKSYGDTPTTIENLLVGDYDVVLSKTGYASVTQRVSISETSPAAIDIKMQKGEMNKTVNSFFKYLNDKTSQTNNDISSNKIVNLTPNWSASVTASQRAVLERLIANMVKVEGGTFKLGGEVTLSDYYIGKYEVTQEEWQAVMGKNPSNFKGNNLPVETVSWNDCQEFIRKLNSMTGMQFSLPTEAQWKYAARGGKHSRGYKYSGSKNIGSVAWYWDNSGWKTHAVGTKQSNELGLYDMSGNVSEWCRKYSSYSQTNPTGPSSGSRCVECGGSWGTTEYGCRVSYSGGIENPDYRGNGTGLRLALVP